MSDRADADAGTIVPTIAVGASAIVEAVPDEAQLHVSLSADGRSSNGTLEAIGKRLDAVDAICDRLEVGADDRSSTVSVNEQGERDGGRWLSKGYRATADLRLVVRSAERVGPLVSAMVEEAGPAVTGPHWRVSPDHPARLEACTKAGRQARSKAEAYAAALDVALGPIVTVTEPGVAAPITREAVRSAAPATMAIGAAESGPGGPAAGAAVDLHPGTQRVYAQVEVVFRIDEG
ncbi:MAG: SIMPL domain-containing protein [Actinomycetota bacterium]